MMGRRGGPVFVVAVAVVLAVVGLVKEGEGVLWKDLPSVTFTGQGATLATPMLNGLPGKPGWLAAYQQLCGAKASVRWNETGSGSGEAAIVARTVDFAITSGDMTEEARSKLTSPLYHFPIALVAADLIFNIPAINITGPLNLTAELVAAILQRNITSWTDPLISFFNPHLKYSKSITPVVRQDAAGTTAQISHYLALSIPQVWVLGQGQSLRWPSGVTTVRGNDALVNAVAATEGSVGYSMAGSSGPNVQLARLQNRDGNWLLPSPEAVRAAAEAYSQNKSYPGGTDSWRPVVLINMPGPNSWPVVMYLYALFYQDQRAQDARGAALASFMQYLNTDNAQAILPNFNAIGVPTAARQVNAASLTAIRLADGYTVNDYTTLPPPRPQPDNKKLTSGAITSIALIAVVGAVLLVVIVIFTYLRFKHNSVEML